MTEDTQTPLKKGPNFSVLKIGSLFSAAVGMVKIRQDVREPLLDNFASLPFFGLLFLAIRCKIELT